MAALSTAGADSASSTRTRRSSAARSVIEDDWEPVNQVELVGRLSAEPSTRVLPSGDEVVGLRVVVPRNDGRSDSFDCSAWTAALRRKASAWHEGDVIEIHGGLRRRFWRSGAGPTSRWEVEISSARRVVRIGARGAG
jgi:single-strand DNA-binding protein